MPCNDHCLILVVVGFNEESRSKIWLPTAEILDSNNLDSQKEKNTRIKG